MLNIIFPRKAPTLGALGQGFSFDAVLEDTLEASIELARYPVESGANVNDHRIINPMKYYMTAAIGSAPLRPLFDGTLNMDTLQNIAIGAASNILRDNPLVAGIAGASIGYLAGSDQTRGAAALEKLIQIMRTGLPFDVDAVDIQLKNMVITKISRTKDPENEEGLVVVIEIQELITLKRIQEQNAEKPTAEQLPDGDPSQTACTRDYHRGQQAGDTSVSGATSYAVTEAVIIPTDIPPLLPVGQ